MLFVVENLELELSEWLCIEYSNAARIVGKKNLLITNVKKKSEREILSKKAPSVRPRVSEIFRQSEILVLDPQSRKKLIYRDLVGKNAVIIGGILGDDPPLGRTKTLLTDRLPRSEVRNLGKHQFSIDGAVHVAKQISMGKSIGEIPVQHGLDIYITRGYSITLPYAFPFVNGKPLISRRLIKYLRRH